MLGHEQVNLAAMVLVVGQTLVNLRPGQIRKAAGNKRVDGFAVLQQTHDIMHSNAGAFDDRASGADSGKIDQITIGGGGHGRYHGEEVDSRNPRDVDKVAAGCPRGIAQEMEGFRK